jgi:hypothetical protein
MRPPLHAEAASRPAAVLLKRHAPGRAADSGCESADRPGRRRLDGEAQLRRARLGAAREPQEKAGDAAIAGAKRGAAGGGKIERCLAQLADRNAHAAAAERRLEAQSASHSVRAAASTTRAGSSPSAARPGA